MHRAAHGTSVKLIMCLLRDRPVDQAMATLAEAIPFQNDEFIGIGVDSKDPSPR